MIYDSDGFEDNHKQEENYIFTRCKKLPEKFQRYAKKTKGEEREATTAARAATATATATSMLITKYIDRNTQNLKYELNENKLIYTG